MPNYSHVLPSLINWDVPWKRDPLSPTYTFFLIHTLPGVDTLLKNSESVLCICQRTVLCLDEPGEV